MDDSGFVYILTNPSFKEDWVKIGKSSRPVDVRSKELDNTAVPLPFEIFATLETSKYEKVEKQIHKQIDRLTDLRIRRTREFFNIKPEVALQIFRDVAELLDDAEILLYRDNKPIVSDSVKTEEKTSQKEKETSAQEMNRRPRFLFSMIGIPIGTALTFIPTGAEVKVSSDNTVEYQGVSYKLSPFVKKFMPVEKRTPSQAYQGAKFFSYNGEILDDIRTKIENNN